MTKQINNQLIYADWLLSCDENFTIIKNGAMVFGEQIIDTGTLEELKLKYPNLDAQYGGKSSVLLPGLINSHVHLEFSANKTTLKYGNFMKWLFSVMEHREELIQKATKELIDIELKQMLKHGTTTIGAISSYGFDMESCIESDLNVVYFTEVLGSKQDMIDTLFIDFQAKLSSAVKNKKVNFIPAVAIHSPYSVHPFLIREVLKIAKRDDLPVSAHFLESKAENDWLNYSTGEFSSFFKDMLDQHQSLQKPSDFLKQFKDIKPLSFTHCVEANEKELEQIKQLGATIIHCPNSNRLLNNTILNLSYLDNIPLAIGTDGLSSNHTLNLFEELRNSFFMHTTLDTNHLAQKLLISATSGGANALGLKKGILEKDFDADFICIKLPDVCEDEEDLATAIILHTSQVETTYIKGKKIELL